MKDISGLHFEMRPDSWDDHVLGMELIEDCYEIGYPEVMVDIGAHIGGSAIRAASRRATVYAYEPSVFNFHYLKKNIQANGLEDRIKTFNKGVGVSGQRKLYKHDSNYGCFSFNADNVKNMSEEYEVVDIINIKDIFKDISHCDLLKVDCEGAETEFIMDIPVVKIDRVSLELHGRKEDKKIREFLAQHYKVKEERENILICTKL